MGSFGMSLLMIGGVALQLVGIAGIVMCAVYLGRIAQELKSYRSAAASAAAARNRGRGESG
jgi:hypothetical protein